MYLNLEYCSNLNVEVAVYCEKCDHVNFINKDKFEQISKDKCTLILNTFIECEYCDNIHTAKKPLVPITEEKEKCFQSQIKSSIHCPKCGSTQIQAVNKKWSPLTGFLTNKVDRVCLGCKNKF